MIYLRKYYLFKIKENNLSVNKNNLYDVLEELFYLSTNKFNYGIKIFDDLCLKIDKDKLINNLKNKYEYQNNQILIEDLENTVIKIKKSFILIETSKNAPSVFKYLNELENNLFVCDFSNKDFFWLNEFVRLNLKISI